MQRFAFLHFAGVGQPLQVWKGAFALLFVTFFVYAITFFLSQF